MHVFAFQIDDLLTVLHWATRVNAKVPCNANLLVVTYAQDGGLLLVLQNTSGSFQHQELLLEQLRNNSLRYINKDFMLHFSSNKLQLYVKVIIDIAKRFGMGSVNRAIYFDRGNTANIINSSSRLNHYIPLFVYINYQLLFGYINLH